MDKSESEILEEWDLVSSDYDLEQEKNQTEKKIESQTEISSNGNSDISSNNVSETNSKATSKIEVENNESGDNSEKTHPDSLRTAQSAITEIETVKSESVVESKAEIELYPDKRTVSEIEETSAEGDVEEMSEPDTEEITVIETIMYDIKKISDVDSEKNIAVNIENNSYDQETGNIISKENNDREAEAEESFDIKNSVNKEETEDTDLKIGSVDSNLEQPVSSSVLTGIYPVLTEQETASIESSSSDIDIIDENIDESVSSSFLHPLSLSISSSVDTSSVLTPSEDDKSTRIEEIKQIEKSESYSVKTDTHPKISEVYAEKTIPKQSYHDYQSSSERKSESVHTQSQRRHQDSNMFSTFLRFLQNMKCLEWSILGGVVLTLCFTVVFNQTNIFAVVEKEDVVSQLTKMIDDLKHDNKLLKDQMLSEMKNEKVFSSVEHQIKELRKENSRLNHMLYDVAKVLEKQKDAHDKYEKKEADYLTPFKKEINKLKEQINSLKIDNEELQKQLVRIRYASYSQGAKDMDDDKNKKKKEEMKIDEPNSADEIPIDINSLKKWNELISLLSKELGLSLEGDSQSKGKSYSESRKNINWYWKIFLQDFKGTFEEFKANITSKLSDYRKVHENTISDIYKVVKDFFTVEEQNKQKFIPPGEESSRWNNFGDFFNDLKDKWNKIKNRIDASDLKNFFKDFKLSGNDETPQYESQKPKSSSYEPNERKPTTVHFESEKKPTNVHFGSDRKYDKAQKDSEDAKWMFERAALRAEMRDTEKEEEVNWFLKKNKQLSEDESEENKY